MRARLALKSAGQQVELREILLRDKPSAFLEVSRTATVPVLVLAEGRVIEESRDIMFWALEAGGDPEGWLSGWQQDRQATDSFIRRLDGPFKTDLDKYKYATRFAADKQDASELARHHQVAGAAFIYDLNDKLNLQGYLNGSSPGLADYAALPFIRQFRIADINWFDRQDWLAVHNWLQAFLNSGRFADIMQKYSPWHPDDDPVLF